MEDKNVKQKEFWSGAGGDVWVDKQREMDIMLNPLGKNAINKIDFSDKLTILDIGCGCGDTSLDIAKKVPKGKPIKQERKSEIPLTFNESNNISNKSSSNVVTNSNDFRNASNKIFI